ncbi:MAG: protein translocase subunit SecD [Pseudomonadota bacterium]
MPRAWQWKTGTAFFFTMLAVWFSIPNFVDMPETKEAREQAPWFIRILPNSKIKLGLDLQGGIHMVLGIDLDRAMLNESDRMARDLKEFGARQEIKIDAIDREFDSTKLKVKLASGEESDKFERFLSDHFNVLITVASEPTKGTYTLDLDPQRHAETEKQTVSQALETLRNRLDEFGVAEPSIQAQGRDRIVVQLPGMDDPVRARNVLGRTAQLEFRIVDDESLKGDRFALENLVTEAKKTLPKKYKIGDLNRAVHDKLPPGTEILMKEDRDPTTDQVTEVPLLVKLSSGLTGDKLEDARIGSGEFNTPTVNLRFNPAGAEILDGITRDSIGKRLAIVLDDKIQSDPVIRARISDGRPQITFGSLKSQQELLQEAKDLSLVLRAGALPAPVEILESRTVGPTLGRDSIESGMKAILVGVLAIVLFMAAYYRMSGVAADLALIVNIVFILACLGALHATLTLPGIAGILISIGMAVDANVLIYERIREELRNGKSINDAIELGYDRAHLTILDSNLTTVIAGLVLLEFGTGPIKGFAVTLIFGLIANYFTALWFTRLAYEWIMLRFKLERLSV